MISSIAHFAVLAKQASVCGQLVLLLPKSDTLSPCSQHQQRLVIGMNMIGRPKLVEPHQLWLVARAPRDMFYLFFGFLVNQYSQIYENVWTTLDPELC